MGSAVTFNGTDAAFEVEGGDIVTAVPAGATSGPLAVTTDGGTVVGATDFTVIPVPTITRLRPTSGKRGATVTITGTGFGATRSGAIVKFGSKACGRYLSGATRRSSARSAKGEVRPGQGHGDHGRRREQLEELPGQAVIPPTRVREGVGS